MIVLEIFSLALNSLKRNKVRSFLTMLGIIIGVSAVILLVSLGSGLSNYITQQFESLGSNILYVMPGQVLQEGGGFSNGPPNFAGSKLTVKDARDIARLGLPIVDAGASTEQPISLKYGNVSKYGQIHGVTENFFKIYNIEVDKGREITRGDIEQQRKVMVMGPAIAEKIFGDQEPLGKKVLAGDYRYEIIGITAKKGSGVGPSMDDIVYITISDAQRQFNQDNVQTIIIEVADKESIDEAKMQATRFLKRHLKADEFSVVDQASLLSTITSIISVLTAALGGIAAISLIVGGIGIMNIMLVSVTERTKEIGLRKAVGAKPKDILYQFLIEAVTLCLIGGTIGILIGTGGSALASKFIPTTVPLWAVLLAFGFSALVGIIFGVAPAYKAAKLDPIEALRYE